jgi:hypothetical protein
MTLIPLTIIQIEQIARELCDRNGTTTTLEIKNECRLRGIWALQSTVAAHVRSLSNPSILVPTLSIDHIQSVDSTFFRVFKLFINPNISRLTSAVVSAPIVGAPVISSNRDWLVHAPTIGSKSMTCDGNLTRSQARNLFAKAESVPFSATRSYRLDTLT